MTRAPQDQVGGEGSTNLQAGRDVHLHGLTLTEAREVALDVYRANALELRGIAQAAAISRAEELTNDFLEKISTENPDSAQSLADPDMQSVLFEAQKEFARSGEEDLKTALIDLLASRAAENERDVRALALNEAIHCAPKLTERQRRAVAWVFYLRYTRYIGHGTISHFYDDLGVVISALGFDVPQKMGDYQHIEYVGVGTLSFNRLGLGAGISRGVEGLFTSGFTEEGVDPVLLAKLRAANLIRPCLRNPQKLQLNHLADEDLTERIKVAHLEGELDAIRPLMSDWRMSEEEILEEAVGRFPGLATLRESWGSDQTGLSNLTLTSVGLALGHAYWARLTGSQAPLSIWL